MEEFNLAVLTPTLGTCKMDYAQSLVRLVMYFIQNEIFPGIRQRISTSSESGTSIAENYERLVSRYINDTNIYWTHFLTIEDDMGFPPHALHTIARRKVPVIGANYITKSLKPQFLTKTITSEKSMGIERVSFLPQGFTLVERKVYESIPKPWFMTCYNIEINQYVHQDYFFSKLIDSNGFPMYVDHDISKEIYHIGSKNYTWKDIE